jgi:hypothetical protein|tara:strand:+ start:418 stop:1005 length:588 start_codon:yes stop_codon:yes gene_type:complete
MLTENTPEFTAQAGQMKRSTPGEAMSNNPDSPYPFEGATEFTVQREALEYLFTVITDETKYAGILGAIDEGVPIMELTQVILFKGFTEGKWNPDLLMLLAEPLAYMLIALAERQGIEYVVNGDDNNEETEEDRDLVTKNLQTKLQGSQSKVKSNITLPPELVKKIEEVPILEESLLGKQPELEAAPDSLLAQQGA